MTLLATRLQYTCIVKFLNKAIPLACRIPVTDDITDVNKTKTKKI